MGTDHKADENPSVIGAVIDLGLERFHKMNRALGRQEYDSVRGIFVEGNAIYPNSGIFAKTHIQICVRNPNCIKGYFAPKEFNCDFTRI